MPEMTPGRRRQIAEIYRAALARDEPDRTAFLSEACENDAGLRREVDSLLNPGQTVDASAGEMAPTGLAHGRSHSLIGRQVGACTVVSFLGAGGMGEVYRARDTRLGRDVAIKVLSDAFAAEPERLVRFRREARLLAAVNHPHIATIHSLEEFGGIPALVMELVEGPTLAERVATGPLPVTEALNIARQLVDALGAAHARGIVHRDLKPANIKIAPGNVVKVLDFGLAKAIGVEAGPSDVTRQAAVSASAARDDLVVGTPAYMSPEQARGKPVDARTDVWAFGCVLYEMMTARAAFGGETIVDTIAAVLEREPDWSALPDRTPSAVRWLLRRCLEKADSARLPSIDDARSELDEAHREPPNPGLPPPERSIHSLAVLPFANASGDPQMDYLSDGLTEAIIAMLSQLPQLRVMARSTVFRFKGHGDDAQELGRRLGVEAVATGRVHQRGDTLIISAELVDVDKGWQIWGAQYRRTAADIFATEEEISKEISAKLRVNLTPHNRALLAKRYTENVEAYHLYLKGKFSWGKRTRERLIQGIEYFRQAIEVDPTYALAYAGLAVSYAPMIFYGYIAPKEGALKGKALARKALEIDPTLPEARTLLASLKWSDDRDYAGSERDLRAVIESDPNDSWARQILAEVLTSQGRTAEAIAETERALEIDPLSLSLNAYAALERYYARQYGEAIDRCRKILEMEGNFYLAHSILGMVFAETRRFAEAVAELQQARALSGNSMFVTATLAAIHAAGGQVREAETELRELDAAEGDHGSRALRSLIYSGLGDRDRALSCLERALEDRDPQLVFIKVDPRFDGLRSEPRFQAILQQMGLAS